MMNLNKIILIIIITFYSYNDAVSQEIDPLMNYLEIATKNNPTVLQKYAEYEAALQKVPQVGSLPDPELNAGVFLSPMELIDGKQLADFRLMQMFPWFGTLKAAKDEMSLMAKAKYESFRDAKLQVIYEAQQTWFDLYKVQQAIEISKKNIEILNTLERLSLIKFKSASIGGISSSSAGGNMQNTISQRTSSGSSGMNSMSGNTSNSNPSKVQPSAPIQNKPMNSSAGSGLIDLYRIQIETSDLENNIALLNDQKNTLIVRFNSILNREAQESVKIPDTLISNSLHIPILNVTDSILVKNPMLSMLNYEKQALEARKVMVTKMGYPMIGLGLNYALIGKNPMSTLEMNGNDMIMPMVTLTLPIYRKKYKAMKTEVEKLKTATEHQQKATANTLTNDYYEAVKNYEDAQRKIVLYAKQYSLANQSLNILIKSFSSAGVGLTDLLIIQQQTLNYELKQVEAVADFNTEIAKLNRLMAYLQIQ
ncbi:TolC family protein [Lutibacter sp.]|uniref:TolC family protein n=1 Tax=Lutibacter sp. TaxID=1925666 RepID=UPI0027343F92|nr:TolC family protein [Lutibacter sp.]MDP3312021.1 TolC family protein [Lutibacter sp.]